MSFVEESFIRRRWRIVFLPAILLIGLVFFAFHFQYSGWNSSMETMTTDTQSVGVLLKDTESKTYVPFYASHRKILQVPEGNKEGTEQIWMDKCSTSNILITQTPTDPLPNGIPTYTVEISNVCPTGCNISHIRLSCGWFGSARVINPRIFKRLHFDVCLVNGGHTLLNGHTLSFQYANTYSYRLAVSSFRC